MPHDTQHTHTAGPSHADTVERLLADFEAQLPLPAVVAVVQRCRHELDTAPRPALAELVERLAGQRLHDLTGASASQPRQTRHRSRRDRP